MTDSDVAAKFGQNARRSLCDEQLERSLTALIQAPSAQSFRELPALIVPTDGRS